VQNHPDKLDHLKSGQVSLPPEIFLVHEEQPAV
jgi:hypothetical protein